MLDLVGNPEDQFSRDVAHIMFGLKTPAILGYWLLTVTTQESVAPSQHVVWDIKPQNKQTKK